MDALFYRGMLDKLNEFPGFDAVLEVDGARLMVGRDEAVSIIQRHALKNAEEMRLIGLEFDE